MREDVVIWLVTVSPSGTPEPSPVWFVWDGERFLIYSRANTPRERNIRANPRIALHLDGDRRGGDIVVFGGQATIVEDAPPAHANPTYLDKYREQINRIGLTPEQFSTAYPLAIRVEPTRLRGH